MKKVKSDKKLLIGFISFIVLVLLVGGVFLFLDYRKTHKEEETEEKTDLEKVQESTDRINSKNKKKLNDSGTGSLYCSRNGVAQGDLTVNMKYVVNYENNYITTYYSIEGVQIEDGKDSEKNQEYLTQYYDAYNSIKSNYDDIEDYTITVNKENNYVTMEIEIDYNKVDVSKIISIEGEEDNIFENKKASVSKWLDLASSVGTECEKTLEDLEESINSSEEQTEDNA